MKVTPSGIANAPYPNFSTVPKPVAGSTSISDANGNLIFMSDGEKVFDKNLRVMPGASNINLGSDDKMLAFPIPQSSRYYLFYAQRDSFHRNSTSRLKYAVVDLSLNGGTGDIVSHDQLVDTALSAGFTIAAGANPGEGWLVTHRMATTTFRSYRITTAGLSTTPVESNAGTVATTIDYIFRDLKTSHNGKMIAGIAYRDHSFHFAETWSFTEVFNFNAAAGTLSNMVRTYRRIGYFETSLSVEFSPDNRLLYTGYMSRIYGLQPCGYGFGAVRQYNLCYTDSSQFSDYSVLVSSSYARCVPDASWGRIQLGADKRIHMPFSGYIVSQIQNPNRVGTSANFLYDAHRMPEANGNIVIAPTFYHKELAKAVQNNIVYDGGCFPEPLSFKISNEAVTSVRWNFGDPASGAANTSNAVRPHHSFSAPGLYTITATVGATGGLPEETVTELIEVKDPDKRLLHAYPKDTVFCGGNKLKLKLQAVNAIFIWKARSEFTGQLYNAALADSFEISETGTYYVEMRQNDCNGCILTDSIKVTVLPTPLINLGPDQDLCSGDTLELNAGVYDADMLWNTGAITPTIKVSKPGTYWMQAEYNNNGCPQRDSITISQIQGVPEYKLPSDTTLCSGESLLLKPGLTGEYYYSWQDWSNESTMQVTAPGTYWVRVALPNGCYRSDTVRVNYVDAQGINLGADTTLCLGSRLTLGKSITNATYQWSTGETSPTITVEKTGKYWVKVSNGSCVVADTISVTFQTPAALNLGKVTSVCEGSTLVLRPRIPNATFLWRDNSTLDSFVVKHAGVYWVQVEQGGCIVYDTIKVAYKSLPTLSLGADTTICAAASFSANISHPSIAAYRWQDGTTRPDYTFIGAGLYWVQATGVNGCVKRDSITVQQFSLPAFNLGKDTALCTDQSLRYSFAHPGAQYQWSTGSTTGNSVIAQPGRYWLQVSQNGCTAADTIVVTAKPSPKVALGNDTIVCAGSTVALSAFNASATYLWSNGATSEALTVSNSGSYRVVVNLNGCTAADTINIAYRQAPRFTLGSDTTLCTGQSFDLAPAVRDGNYRWHNGSDAPIFKVQQPGTYRLTVTNECGTHTDDILVSTGVCQLIMPTAFTPNGDGLNDLFRVKHPQFIKTFNMEVYNRWGQVVYKTNNAAGGWNGRFRNMDQPNGNYIWMITMTDLDGKKSSYQGEVMLLR
ncbi:gliding motility-associated C-terminal domain-containing protein [Paracnuella aquatica]|uniref:gliding motility-associated C-terminal domain-containing protein n=1 Tax=Paracnuella aquatica TaxID=2268757 RepID=UPI001390094C|nr:gliding motility-associated C-terminal domain-containing protein [Paracnuella aquatica]